MPIACPVKVFPLTRTFGGTVRMFVRVKVFLLTRTFGGVIRMFVIRFVLLAVSHSSRSTGDRSYLSMPIASSIHSELIHLQLAL